MATVLIENRAVGVNGKIEIRKADGIEIRVVSKDTRKQLWRFWNKLIKSIVSNAAVRSKK